MDVFLAYVFERDQHAAVVADVGEDLLLGRAEAGHGFELARPGDTLGAHDALLEPVMTLLEPMTLVNGALYSSLSFVDPELIVWPLFRLPLAYQ